MGDSPNLAQDFRGAQRLEDSGAVSWDGGMGICDRKFDSITDISLVEFTFFIEKIQ